MADFGIGEVLRRSLLTEKQAEIIPVLDPDEFERLAATHNRRVAASGRLNRITRWQVVGDEGHA